jgi:hypothetical protein
MPSVRWLRLSLKSARAALFAAPRGCVSASCGDRRVNLDSLFKRSFPALTCALVALSAYVQAFGFASLLAETLLTAAPEVAPRMPLPLPASASDEHATSAAPILARNLFDSIDFHIR